MCRLFGDIFSVIRCVQRGFFFLDQGFKTALILVTLRTTLLSNVLTFRLPGRLPADLGWRPSDSLEDDCCPLCEFSKGSACVKLPPARSVNDSDARERWKRKRGGENVPLSDFWLWPLWGYQRRKWLKEKQNTSAGRVSVLPPPLGVCADCSSHAGCCHSGRELELIFSMSGRAPEWLLPSLKKSMGTMFDEVWIFSMPLIPHYNKMDMIHCCGWAKIYTHH